MNQYRLTILALTGLLLLACGKDSEPVIETDAALQPVAGTWRAVLDSPGGELPFELVIEEDLSAYVRNGSERATFSGVTLEGQKLVLAFDWYDAEISADLSDDASVMRGRWRKTTDKGDSTLDFSATRGMAVRFLPLTGASADTLESVQGSWRVRFTDEDGDFPARAEFRQTGQQVTGTFLTATGDYRFLEGSFEAGVLRLSTFDGAHAFLFRAQPGAGGSLNGDFWSRDSYHATWTAQRMDQDEAVLPNPWEQVSLVTEEPRIDFQFEDLEGRMVSLDDPRFADKVVLVNLFGSWCPNCNDEAPILSRWYRDRRDEGLEIVGLAFEYTGDLERDREMVRRFAQRHDIQYPLLVAGVSDKQKAAEAVGFLDKVVAYPTTIFLDREHRVQRIHSGFAGPGTGEHHVRLVAELEAEIERLLAE